MPSVEWGPLFAKANREVKWNDQGAKGFVRLTLTRKQAKAEMIAVSSIVERDFKTRTLKTFAVRPGPNGVSGVREV
jgi:alkaline phosphatase D